MGQKRLRTFLAHKFYNAFLQRYLVVDLFALLNDDALGQLFCGKADSGSGDLFAVCQHTALYYAGERGFNEIVEKLLENGAE